MSNTSQKVDHGSKSIRPTCKCLWSIMHFCPLSHACSSMIRYRRVTRMVTPTVHCSSSHRLGTPARAIDSRDLLILLDASTARSVACLRYFTVMWRQWFLVFRARPFAEKVSIHCSRFTMDGPDCSIGMSSNSGPSPTMGQTDLDGLTSLCYYSLREASSIWENIGPFLPGWPTISVNPR